MELLALFTNRAPTRAFVSLLLGIVVGIAYAMLLPLIFIGAGAHVPGGASGGEDVRRILWFDVANYRLAMLFAGTCVLIVAARAASQTLLSRIALDATSSLRTSIYLQIMKAPIADLERIGQDNLMAAITTDVQRAVAGAMSMPILLISLVTVAGMFGYLWVLDRDVFGFVAEALVFGIVTYQVPMMLSQRYFRRSREDIDSLYGSIRGLLQGIKELKLSRTRRERYFREVLQSGESAILASSNRGSTIATLAISYGDLLGFVVIGVITFIFVNYHSIGSNELAGVVMVLLYITGPVSMVLNAIPQIALAMVSLRKMKQVIGQIPEERAVPSDGPGHEWRVARFIDVSFQYAGHGDPFRVGPLSFEIARGQVTFIIGGNGSGKSTLGKLISLHYAPSGGEVLFDGHKVDLTCVDRYRESISVIFADYFVFDRILERLNAYQQTLVSRYLVDLGLANVVTIKNQRFSTTTALSSGQRRRLALLVVLLEDRPLCIFDEWAADQDPAFKRTFYYQILPALRAKQKAVVVISHDDRYFDVADRILVLEDGKLARVECPRDGRDGRQSVVVS
jgi:putative ATP-binding cassette transporter